MHDRTNGDAPLHIIVLCHPEQESFNASVATAYASAVRKKGHRAIVRDLYAMGFKPVLKSAERPGPGFREFGDVEQELQIIREAEVFVLVYPLWFGTPPAMMKGYLERVLGTGVLPVDIQAGTGKGALAGKHMVSFTSSATTEIWLDGQGQLGSLVNGFDRYIEHGFAMKPSRHFHYGHVVSGMREQWVDQNLQDVRERAEAVVHDLEKSPVASSGHSRRQ